MTSVTKSKSAKPKPKPRVACILNKYGDKGPEYVPIVEMWESFSGWYWYITERRADREDPDIMFGFVRGFEDEWGYISRSELEAQGASVWQVPKANWPNNSYVKMVEPGSRP